MPSNPNSVSIGDGSARRFTGLSNALQGVSGTPYTGTAPMSQLAESGAFHTHTSNEVSSDTYGSVEKGLEHLSGVFYPEPAKLGQHGALFTGIPDWGVLKLSDGDLVSRGLATWTNDPAEVYPYWWTAPSPALGPAFEFEGQDPATDPIFNSDTALLGAGSGAAFAGGFTRPGTAGGPAQPVIKTVRVLQRTGTTRQEVTVSGMVYPADRGVLALVHWPVDGSESDFTAQALGDRCIAALLLGRGLLPLGSGGEDCYQGTSCDGTPVGDGDPGGIFHIGGQDSYDPFSFPGKATGQYNLSEIHANASALDGSLLRDPFTTPSVRVASATTPALGQVRLGTDPSAGATPTTYGIPILGGSTNAYSPLPGTTINGNVAIDNSIILNSNFFAYRLPVVKDYSMATGLQHTPSGVDPSTTKEKFRYFQTVSPASVASLTQAGGYANFETDNYTWQIARYRHTFALPSNVGSWQPQECGSYWLIHFKKEAHFELFVRDGIMPWHPTNGYTLYGAHLLTASPEDYGNVVNEDTSSEFSPRGPAPDYGHSARSYHVLAQGVYQDPNPAINPAHWTTSFQWSSVSVPSTEVNLMAVSGVWYFLPRNSTDGSPGFEITDISISGSNFWRYSYRTDDKTLTGGADPARYSNMCPLVIGVAPFSYGETLGVPHHSCTTGVPGAAITDAEGLRRQRIEIPYTHLGGYSDTDGPRHNSTASSTLVGNLTLAGDLAEPSFTQDARLRVFLRKPLGHATVNDSALPFSSTLGHGLEVAPSPSDRVLYHSTRFDTYVLASTQYGNFNTGVTPSPVHSPLCSNLKYYQERFLDEVFRWDHTFPLSLPTNVPDALSGPGLGAWFAATGGAPCNIPVNIGMDNAPSLQWRNGSWVYMGLHTESLVGATPGPDTGLQVAGLPERNPPLSDGAIAPFPSAGILQYPQTDYTTGYRPDATDMSMSQPDYSGAPTAGGERVYVRAFDAAMKGLRPTASGSTTVKLKILGLTLSDFEYVPSAFPGSLSTRGIALMLKVPGLTTWMDLGRADGSGPSKQDPLLDGAGCKVVGVDTFDGIDPLTGLAYCQVLAEVGPVASLFTSSFGDVPILVKVVYNENAADYNLTMQWSGGSFVGSPQIGYPSSEVRGLVGLELVA